jgi:hypothetical protein
VNPQTPVLKRPDKIESGRRQLKSRDRLHVEARPESEDLTPRSDTTEQESPSTEPEQQGQKRKSSYAKQ